MGYAVSKGVKLVQWGRVSWFALETTVMDFVILRLYEKILTLVIQL